MEKGSDDLRDNGIEFEKKGKTKDMKSVENGSDAPTPNKSNKKVRFSGQVEVFSIPSNSNNVKDNEEDNMSKGKRSETRRWTQYDEIRKYQEEHGNEWKVLAEEFGRHRVHVKDTWRRIKLSGRKKGHWSQEEYQKLFNLVNVDLQAKLSEEKRSKHGMLRDNIWDGDQ
ncbi:hypothetical protein OROMI_007867 [Orobanche minor]